MRKGTKPPSRSIPKPAKSPVDWAFIQKVLECLLVRTIYLFGPPGIGKTWSAYNLGRTHNGVYAVTLTEDTPASELRGHYLYKGQNTIWHDGPFTRALREGARLVVNEISHAAPDVLALLYPVLESVETAQLTLPSNETVRPAPGFNVVCTDNASPEFLPAALVDRFDCVLEITAPHPDAMAALSEPLRRVAESSFDLEADRRVGLRGWLTLERLRTTFGLRDACVAIFGPERGAQLFDALVLAGAHG